MGRDGRDLPAGDSRETQSAAGVVRKGGPLRAVHLSRHKLPGDESSRITFSPRFQGYWVQKIVRGTGFSKFSGVMGLERFQGYGVQKVFRGTGFRNPSACPPRAIEEVACLFRMGQQMGPRGGGGFA